jgi:hypothetical protein
MFKKLGFWFSVSFLVIAIISAVFYFLRKNEPQYPNEMISFVSETFKKDLKQFLKSAEKSVDKLESNIGQIDVDSSSAKKLDVYFSDLIRNEKYLQGVIIFGKDMNYVIYKEENSWVTSHNNMNDSSITWTRMDDRFEKMSSWLDTYNFFMVQQELDLLKTADLKAGEHVWRTARSERPSSRDLFFNIFKLQAGENEDVFAFMYRTQELGTRFSAVLRFENPLVTIITAKNTAVTPIRTEDTSKIRIYRELESEVMKAYETWQEAGPDKPFTVSFSAMNSDFWVGLDSISPVLGARGFAVTIAEQDLTENKKRLDEAFLYLAILFFIFAVAAILPIYRKTLGSKTDPPPAITPLPTEEIVAKINNGETEHVEFKSSLRWDFREEKPNRLMEDIILKSIAAFSNAKGGTLMIGVTDDLDIIGLEHDFKTLKKQDADYFELHLRKLINNQFGIRYSNKHLLFQFPEIHNKQLCIVQVAPGDSPVYVKTRNKQGHEVEKFFVRSGNSSQEISSLKEINEYIKSRFGT